MAIKKIAIAGGHSKKAPGAVGYLDEYKCDRAYVAKLKEALKAADYQVIDCSNEAGDQNSELAEKVRLANASGADLFVDVHLNAGKGTGTEAYTHTETTSALAKEIAKRMSANVASAMGIRDRGAKQESYYVLRKTTMPAVLLEVCFVDSETDRDAWNRTSWDALTKAFVDAIGGNAASAPASKPPSPASKPTSAPAAKPAAKPSNGGQQWIRNLQTECNKQGFSHQTVDGIAGPNTIKGCPTLRKGARGNITKIMQQRLNSLGYSCGKADGIFGSDTYNAVVAFQKAKKLTPDAVVGKNTWRKLLGL